MIIIPNLPFLHRRRAEPTTTAAGPLTLVSATYDHEAPSLTLTFNQPINTDAMQLPLIGVHDGLYLNQVMGGVTTTGLTETSVTVELEPVGPSEGGVVRLYVDAGNGIFAVNGGAEWEGAEGVELPFES